jgi:PASTA domain
MEKPWRICMNVQTSLRISGKSFLVGTFASFVLFCAISLSSPIPQQGEFVPQKPATVHTQIETPHYPVAIASFPQQIVKVPELIKRNLKDAENVLRASKLLMGQPQFVASNEPPGTVVRQYPEADTTIRIGTTVLVWVSAEQPKQPQKPQPAPGSGPDYVDVPNLLHLREGDARAILKKTGFPLGGVAQVPSTDQRPGTVVEPPEDSSPKRHVGLYLFGNFQASDCPCARSSSKG